MKKQQEQKTLGGNLSARDGVCLKRNISETKRFIGWSGYCLDFNVDRNRCELWYPVDTPSNAINRFNLYSTAGYLPPDGSGKYWCVQAKGNANIGDSSSSYKLVTRNNDNYLFNLYFWDYEASEADRDNVSFGSSPERKTWIDVIVPANDKERVLHYSEIIGVGVEPRNRVGGTDRFKQELIAYRDQTIEGRSAGKGLYWSEPLKVLPNGDLAIELFWQENSSPEHSSFDGFSLAACRNYEDIEGEDYNAMAWRIIFDRDTGLMKQHRAKNCDASSKSGGLRTNINFYLTEVCSDVRQVLIEDVAEPFGVKSKGRTDRLWSESKYTLGRDRSSPTTNYTDEWLRLPYDQFFTPFGSLNQTSDPVVISLRNYLNEEKTQTAKRELVADAGYWPIWLAPGGGTPLNCDADSSGNCGTGSFCSGGPNANMPCDPEGGDDSNGCQEQVADGTCDFLFGDPPPANPRHACIPEGKTINDMNSVGDLYNSAECFIRNQDSYDYGKCSGGKRDNKPCFENTQCDGGLVPHTCVGQETSRGMCVGGSRHGLTCASSEDCPETVYNSVVSGEKKEYGICVGSGLNLGRKIPDTVIGRSMERLFEIFVEWYGTWDFNKIQGHYQPYLDQDRRGYYQSSLASGSRGNYDDSCDGYPNDNSCDRYANFTVHKPEIHSVVRNVTNNQFAWGAFNTFSLNGKNDENLNIQGGGAVVLQFYAYADNNQMPLTRIKINWGDSTPVYSTSGWFKNRKPVCDIQKDYRFCKDDSSFYYNLPCRSDSQCPGGTTCEQPTSDYARLYFGNSPDACQEGYFEFTHYYRCNKDELPRCTVGSPTDCYDDASKECRFTPKVQVMDNWDWCSGNCGGKNGCYNGGEKECDWHDYEVNHWVNYNNKIIIKP